MANLQKIKDLAEDRKMSIRDLAEKVGLKENQIHVMCRTNSTKIDTLEKIAYALGVPVAYFFDEEIIEEKVEVRKAGRDYVEKGKIEHRGAEHNETNAGQDYRDEIIAQLRSQLADKERIIKLMESK